MWHPDLLRTGAASFKRVLGSTSLTDPAVLRLLHHNRPTIIPALQTIDTPKEVRANIGFQRLRVQEMDAPHLVPVVYIVSRPRRWIGSIEPGFTKTSHDTRGRVLDVVDNRVPPIPPGDRRLDFGCIKNGKHIRLDDGSNNLALLSVRQSLGRPGRAARCKSHQAK
jgi:hypothetical protein